MQIQAHDDQLQRLFGFSEQQRQAEGELHRYIDVQSSHKFGHLPGRRHRDMRDKRHDVRPYYRGQRIDNKRHGRDCPGSYIMDEVPSRRPRGDVHRHNHAHDFIGAVRHGAASSSR